jgi:large subunit ribosomal protein L37Ae
MLRTPKYGRKIRKQYNEILRLKKEKYICPKCEKKKLKRISFALFRCKSCNVIITGGAYKPSTEAGETIKRMLAEIKKEKE